MLSEISRMTYMSRLAASSSARVWEKRGETRNSRTSGRTVKGVFIFPPNVL
jgi:hypothetical protein